ncbi:MAG: transglycosylase SLT domain-containing protein [Rhizobiaceae bacterium]|nr:transglycosylase SLT domain-containing protein [Rhizobiaceae bacterium]
MNWRNQNPVKTLLILTAFISSISVNLGFASETCEEHIIQAAQKYNIPVGILYSVGLTETGKNGTLHPFALNIAGKAVYARSNAHAIELFHNAKQRNVKLIDLGCMQINHHYHHSEFSSLSAMLNPKTNVNYAAKFLARLKRRHKNWTMAVARYHAGPNNNPAHKRYVCRVISNLVATGYGNWTPQARQFCQS